jgi:hypothetical protein
LVVRSWIVETRLSRATRLAPTGTRTARSAIAPACCSGVVGVVVVVRVRVAVRVERVRPVDRRADVDRLPVLLRVVDRGVDVPLSLVVAIWSSLQFAYQVMIPNMCLYPGWESRLQPIFRKACEASHSPEPVAAR